LLRVFIKFIFNLLYRTIYRVEVVGLENWNQAQPKVVCPNHIDYKDPLVFGSFIPDYIRFMAKKELFSNRLFDWFFRGCGAFPVDRTGNDIGAVKAALRFLKAGESSRSTHWSPFNSKVNPRVRIMKTRCSRSSKRSTLTLSFTRGGHKGT